MPLSLLVWLFLLLNLRPDGIKKQHINVFKINPVTMCRQYGKSVATLVIRLVPELGIAGSGSSPICTAKKNKI